MANSLSAYWPWILGAVLLLALLILLALVLLLRKSAKVSRISDRPAEDEEETVAPEAPRAADFARIGSAFRRARKRMASVGDGNVYKMPLVVLLGAEGSREGGFLERTAGNGLELFEDPLAEGMAFADGREFLFFNGGTVLDVAGEPVLGSDGEHADDKAWRRIVRNLVEMRPKRPLDSIVVTVGCGELLDAQKKEPARMALAERAARVRRRLWDLQENAGFRLPLYVLVTNCELVRGFGETCAALPQQMRGQMLGWSSPNGVRMPYQTTWVDDAMSETREALTHLQMELFRSGPQRDGVLLFPQSIGALTEPLRTFLDQLLSPGARHEAAVTRGIYFCGTVPETRSTTAFVADLFNAKIFPEVGLATPTSSMRMTRSRRARTLHAATVTAAILAFVGLGLAAWVMSEREAVLSRLLSDAKEGIQKAPAANDAQLTDEAELLLGNLSKVHFNHFSPWWLPLSWFNGFDRDLHLSFQRSFETIVLKAVKRRLETKADDLISQANNANFDVSLLPVVTDLSAPPLPEAMPTTAPVEPVEKTKEYLALATLVRGLREVEQQGDRFNLLANKGSGDLDDLNAVVKYAFGNQLTGDFFDHPHFYDAMVRNLTSTDRFDAVSYAPRASGAAATVANALYARIMRRNPLADRVKYIAAAVSPGNLRTLSQSGVDPEQFQTLDVTIHNVQKDLSTPTVEWAFRPRLDLGSEFNGLLDAMNRSKIFNDGTGDAIRAAGAIQLVDLRNDLKSQTSLKFPVLKVRDDGAPAMELSRDTDLLHTALETFLGQTGVASTPAMLPIRTGVAGARLTWDPAQLDQAAAVYRAYKDFHDRGMKLFPRDLPPDVATAIDHTAQVRTRMQIADLLAKAQQFPAVAAEQEEDVRLEALAFDASSKALRPHLEALLSLRDFAARNDVIAAQTGEAMRLLNSTNALLNATAPYSPRTGKFDWWDGKASPSPQAWGARDAGALAAYFDVRRARIALLSADAAPLMSWFNDFGGGDVLTVNRWRSIADDLHSYEVKKPGNGPAVVEDYIANRIAKLTWSDCSAAELKPSEKAAGGYFAETLQHISETLTSRCSAIATTETARRYNEVATFFNRQLGGRYPFAAAPPKPGGLEASPEDVRRFFHDYDQVKPLLDAVSDDAAFYHANRFAQKMNKVRAFFAAFLDAKKPAKLPEVNVETAFRILTDLEARGNEIIHWELLLDDGVSRQTTTLRDAGKKLLWRPGTKVKLTVQWAANAPHVPVLPQPQRNAFVDDQRRAVVFQYVNNWALLTALSDLHATAEELPVGSDQQPVTLAINVLTKPASGGEPDPRNPSLVFLRMALTGADGQPLEVPEFPVSAPPLDIKTAEVGQ